MEILPGIHRIESVFENRLVTSYLLCGKRALLVDSGLAYTPEETIFPYVERIGMPVEDIKWLVVTHASGDHFGGNYAIKCRSPETTIVAHELDADCVSDHAIYIREQIDWIRECEVPYPTVRADDAGFLSLHGPETPVDWRVQDGQRIDLGDDWWVMLYHTPGHTEGHLMVHDARHGVIFTGDGLMGNGVPGVDGNLALPPHYFEVDWYLYTIAKVRSLDPQCILATHYQPLMGRQAEEFVEASQAFVERMGETIYGTLADSGEWLDFSSILETVRREVGINVDGFDASNYVYSLPIRAHLRQLVAEGRVVEDKLITSDQSRRRFSVRQH
jgi:glyoxylase-like metal-dependent hydrolase (beta-lactamase superfamily II)